MTHPNAHSSSVTIRQRFAAWRLGVRYRYRQLRRRYPWVEPLRKATVTVAAILLIVAGAAVAPLPGPGGFIAVFGVAVLAAEYHWVRRLMRRLSALAHRWYTRITGRRPRWAWQMKRRWFPSETRPASRRLLPPTASPNG